MLHRLVCSHRPTKSVVLSLVDSNSVVLCNRSSWLEVEEFLLVFEKSLKQAGFINSHGLFLIMRPMTDTFNITKASTPLPPLPPEWRLMSHFVATAR